jgi:ABC-type glutathione transport system ATPase component
MALKICEVRVLHINSLTKVYRRGARANDGISVDMAAGEVLGLPGHNGAGKTTLLSQIVGLVRPTAGRITPLGRDPVADPAWGRTTCSFQPQAQAPLSGVTPDRRSRSSAGSAVPAGGTYVAARAGYWPHWTSRSGRTGPASSSPAGCVGSPRSACRSSSRAGW